MSDTVTEKRQARSVLAARRRRVAAVRVRQLSTRVCARLLALPEIVDARALCLYAALPGEVDLGTLFEVCRARGQGVLLPRFNATTGVYEMVAVRDLATETAPGNLGVHEPLPRLPVGTERQRKAATTTWLVPGLGFDRAGRRLGRGKGFYDRLLSGTRGARIGVAFSWQLLPEIPAEAHDVHMDAVVTETAVFRTGATLALRAAEVTVRQGKGLSTRKAGAVLPVAGCRRPLPGRSLKRTDTMACSHKPKERNQT